MIIISITRIIIVVEIILLVSHHHNIGGDTGHIRPAFDLLENGSTTTNVHKTRDQIATTFQDPTATTFHDLESW